METRHLSLHVPPYFFSGCFQNVKIKKCQGCQDRELVVASEHGKERDLQEFIDLESYKLRRDILEAHFMEHCYQVSMRQGVMVKHCDNHRNCYNYVLKTRPYLLVTTDTKELDLQKCPGHEVLLGHFMLKNRAKHRGLKEQKMILRKVNVEHANYMVITKSSKEAKNRDCFSGIDRVNKYAVYLLYHHYDGSFACPNNRGEI